MKITKSMKYEPSHAAKELTIYAINCREHYQQARPIIELLAKKMRVNCYDPNKAVAIWYRHACAIAKRYDKEFSTPGEQTFTVTDRYTCAVYHEQHYLSEISYAAKENK
jgi:hypothetical protein